MMVNYNVELSTKEMVLVYEALSVASREAIKENNLETEFRLTELRMKFIFTICKRKMRDRENE